MSEANPTFLPSYVLTFYEEGEPRRPPFTVPFLIIHGDKDPIVPVDQSRDFHAALQKAGKESTYIELANEGHGFAQPGSLQKLFNSTREFFAKYLKAPQP